MQTSTLRPGLLVSLKTSVSGNVTYDRRDTVNKHVTAEGSQKARWETERTVTDPVEFEKASKVRRAAAELIRKMCAQSAFGLLCPESAAPQLELAMGEARELVDQFNAEAKLTRVSVYIMTGRIAADDVEAVKAINSEVRDLLADMEEGVKNLDVKKIRDAAVRTKQLGSMLSINAAARIQLAIEAARSTATKIVAAGEQAGMAIDRSTLERINEARTAFLDFEDAVPMRAPVIESRALDMEV